MYDEHEIWEAENILNKLRLKIARLSMLKQEGHLGSSFSILHILYHIYSNVIESTKSEALDKFILSKGHASLGLYAVLNHFSQISDAELESFCDFNSVLGGHPHSGKHGSLVASTGSLGHGLPISVGLALGKLINKEGGRIYCLIGDGEANEGAVWEAALLASEHNLSNLTCIMDMNGSGERAIKMGDVTKKFESFGFECTVVDGHNLNEIAEAFGVCEYLHKPKFILANTIKGKGVSRMENNPEWHHKFPTQREYDEICLEINQL
jgi:transketolase